MKSALKNHLKDEKSTYLLQHVFNPVDWYPWSDEAFKLAKSEKKPIFLSIGYSTCHWCHVMAHESFEDFEIAEILNENFVSIKVDREERPDIDKIYMNVCQFLTGGGGWPLTIIMTPEKKPFFAATYIPKYSRYGIKGLMDLLPEIISLWRNNNDKLLKSSFEISSNLQKFLKSESGEELNKNILTDTYNQLLNSYDELFGGFSFKPKFPMPHNILFLLRYWKRTKDSFAIKMVNTTLEHMRFGGIYDHIGFGFHRYSTDRKWIVPHFEKMLYDQALLILAYAEAYQATKKQIYKKTVDEIIEFVIRDLKSEDGGFYSAIDADSEGVEGKFYFWDYDEIKNIIDKNDFKLFERVFNINKQGNFNPDSGIKGNLNILYNTISLKDSAKYFKINEKEFFIILEKNRKKLFNIREKRIHPVTDNKILCDWNGLMIAALAKAAQVFENKNYAEIAENALNFILKNMMKNNGELIHKYSKKVDEISGFADDYAFLIFGLIELYQATFNSWYLKISLELIDFLMNHFWDNKNGGLYFTSDKNEKLLTRNKEIYDGAIPSSNSVTFFNLIRLARITGNKDLENKAFELSKAFSNQIKKMPNGYTQMMIGLDFAIGPSYEFVIVGNKDNKDTREIIQYLNSIYLPNKVIILKDIKTKKQPIEKLVPFIKDYSQIKNQATVYICKNQQCQLPISDIKKIKHILDFN
jgi:uncharacterized protein YyaL (SSP411 family)